MKIKGNFPALALVGLLTAFAVPRAHATAELTLTDGTTTVTITDGGVGDACGLADCVTYVGAVGAWTLNVTTGEAKGATTFFMDLNDVTTHGTDPAATTLTIDWSDNGFTPAQAGFVTNIGGTISSGGTLTASLFGGNSNTVLDKSQQIGSTLSFTSPPISFSGTDGGPVGTVDPFSLTQQVTLNFGTAPGSASFDYSVSTVPEPTSVALFGGALLFIGSALRRKLRRA